MAQRVHHIVGVGREQAEVLFHRADHFVHGSLAAYSAKIGHGDMLADQVCLGVAEVFAVTDNGGTHQALGNDASLSLGGADHLLDTNNGSHVVEGEFLLGIVGLIFFV